VTKSVKRTLKNGNKPHKLTKKENSRGGSNMTQYRKFVLTVKRRKKCTGACPYHPCRYVPLVKEGKCALQNKDPTIIKKYFNIVLGGEDKLLEEANNALVGISKPTSFIKSCERVHKMRFGSKVKQEVAVSTSFTDELNHTLKELEEE